MNPDAGFDPVGGRLRLTRDLLADMCAAQSGRQVSREAALVSAGLLQDGLLHPRLVPLAQTAARPQVRLIVDVAANRPLHCDGWVGETFALLLAARSATEELFEATFLSRSLLTAQLGRFIGVSPRPRAKVVEPVEIDRGLLEVILGPGDRLTAPQLEMLIDPDDHMLPAWLEVLSILSGGVRARWRAGVWWNSHQESPEARSLEVIDSEAGLFLVSHLPRGDRRYRRVLLRPITPSQVWRLLCALLPSPQEVAEPLSH